MVHLTEIPGCSDALRDVARLTVWSSVIAVLLSFLSPSASPPSARLAPALTASGAAGAAEENAGLRWGVSTSGVTGATLVFLKGSCMPETFGLCAQRASARSALWHPLVYLFNDTIQ